MGTQTTAQLKPALRGRTVLVADDDPTIRDYLSARCNEAGLRVKVAVDGLRALLQVSKENFDLLILDLHLPDVEGFRVCERLTDPKFRPLPVIMLTASVDEETVRRCEELGAVHVAKGPGLWENLYDVMERIFEAAPHKETEIAEVPKNTKVLLVDDDEIILKGLSSRLSKYGIEVLTASNGMQGFWRALKERPAAIVTDYYMAGGDGHYLLSRIKSTPATEKIPVIVLSGNLEDARTRTPIERQLRGRGQAAELLMKPVSAETLLDALERHAQISVGKRS